VYQSPTACSLLKLLATIGRVTILFALLANDSAAAYPIRPVPLGQLIRDSDLIVIADVESYVTEGDGDVVALLRVSSVLQGATTFTKIRVRQYPGMCCPEPPRYLEGDHTLAFLRRLAAADKYETVALSYGARLILPDQEKEAANFVKWHQEASRIPDDLEREQKQLSLFIDETKSVLFRWDGAYSIRSNDKLVFGLTDAQVSSLADSLRDTKEFDRAVPELLRLLETTKSPALAQILLDRLDPDGDVDSDFVPLYLQALERLSGFDLGAKRSISWGSWNKLDEAGRRQFVRRVVSSYRKISVERSKPAKKKTLPPVN
jgi:hypothetical protein